LVFLYQIEAGSLSGNGDNINNIIAAFQTPLGLVKKDGEIWELRRSFDIASSIAALIEHEFSRARSWLFHVNFLLAAWYRITQRKY